MTTRTKVSASNWERYAARHPDGADPAAYLRERIHGSTNAHEHQRFLADVATYDPAQTLLIVVERQGAWHPYRIEIAALALAQSRPAQVSAA